MKRKSRRYRPSLDGLEARDLPSTLAVVGETAGKHRPTAPHLNLVVMSEPHHVSSGAAGALARTSSAIGHGNAPVGQRELPPIVGRPALRTADHDHADPGGRPDVRRRAPTRSHSRRRARSAARPSGSSSSATIRSGAPRFSNQSATIHIFSNGRSVTSNQFFNGRAQILLFPPADPTAKPTTNDPVAGQVAGLFTTFPANVLQSSSSLFAQVTNLPGVASNDPSALDHGLPSRLQFLIDPGGVSGGVYSTPAFSTTPATITDPANGQAVRPTGGSGGAVAFNQGAGMIDIKYIPDKPPPSRRLLNRARSSCGCRD